MIRIIFVHGLIGGAIVSACMSLAMLAGVQGGAAGMAVGYLSMLVGLAFVFVGVKRYRDAHLGGVIRFGTALGVGLAIALVAALIYVIGWELYMFATDYRFMSEFTASLVAQKVAEGATPAEIAKLRAEMDAFAAMYADPATRIGFTFLEIAPVVVIVSLASALLLRRSSFMPARQSQV